MKKAGNSEISTKKLILLAVSSALFWVMPAVTILMNLLLPINLPSLSKTGFTIISIIISALYVCVFVMTLVLAIKTLNHKSYVKALYLVLVIFQTAFVALVLLVFITTFFPYFGSGGMM